MHVNVKWGKQLFKDVEVDLEQPPFVFKTQLFSLSGVPPERQKVMIKAKILKDDSWESVSKLADGQTVLLMGTAETEAIAAPKGEPELKWDQPEEEEEVYAFDKYGSGLKNMGNTCYMNSTMQLLYAVPELRQRVMEFGANRPEGASALALQLTTAASELFRDMQKGRIPVMPVRFLLSLRNKYPQFAEMDRVGYKQQDAEECFSQIATTFMETIKVNGEDGAIKSQISDLFGIDFVTELTCKETDEHRTLRTAETKLKCNIPQAPPINHVHEGIREGLKADRSQTSERTGTEVTFEGVSEIAKLPSYVVLHMVRFDYRRDTNRRAKILRKVTFPAKMDLYDFCTEKYKEELDVARKQVEKLRDEELEKHHSGQAAAESSQPSETEAQTAVQTEGDVVMAEGASRSESKKALTGAYQLVGLLTHKGRIAEAGHYVAWVKQEDKQWIEFDDENLIPTTEEQIMQLSGGGDWHMAYLLLYKAETVDLE